MDFYNQMRKPFNLDFEELKEEIDHPFLNHLFNEKLNYKHTKPSNLLKEHYQRALLECYGQRNSILHSGIGNEKALILIDNTIPKLVTRLRWALFDGMRKYKDLNFDELLKKLVEDSELIITK